MKLQSLASLRPALVVLPTVSSSAVAPFQLPSLMPYPLLTVSPSQLYLEWFCSTLSCMCRNRPKKDGGEGDIYESCLMLGVCLGREEEQMDAKTCVQDRETRG